MYDWKIRQGFFNVGHNDPVNLCGLFIAQLIKGTPGITGWSLFRVHIDGAAWHLDVGSSLPGAEVGSKGMAVRQINAVRELGLERCETVRFLSVLGENIYSFKFSTRGPKWISQLFSHCFYKA